MRRKSDVPFISAETSSLLGPAITVVVPSVRTRFRNMHGGDRFRHFQRGAISSRGIISDTTA